MDPKVLAEIFERVFGGDLGALESAMKRLKLQGELVQINSKYANVQQEADKNASQYVQALDELNAMRKAKQEEIDNLEK